MAWSSRAGAALLALAFVTLAALPLAAADHAYSHRFIVYGRVVDANNDPVPGLTVDLGYEQPFAPEGACANQPGTDTEAFGPTRTTPITNQYGEFIFCFHTHAMSRTEPGEGILRIDAVGIEKRFPFDGYMRYAFVPVQLDVTREDSNRTLLTQFYTVAGRGWQADKGETRVEGVRVYGDTLHNMEANITFAYNGKDPVTVSTPTNNYGDFAVRIPVAERATTGTVTVSIGEFTWTAAVDPSGVTFVRAEEGIERVQPIPSLGFLGLLFAGLAAIAVLRVRRG